MSGHSFGAGGDPARQQLAGLTIPSLTNTELINHQKIQANMNIKASMTAVRPIAPNPSVTQVAHPLQVSATQLLGGATGQTSISSKIANAIGLGTAGSQIASSDHSPQLTAVNLTNQAVSQSSSGTQIRTLSTQQPLLQLHSQPQAGAGLTPQNVVRLQNNSVQVATMSSIIKGGVPLVQAQQPGAQGHQTGSHTTHQMQQVFPTHLPRGAAAASQLTATKASGVATPMLRPSQPGATALQIPSSNTATIVPTVGVAQHIQPRAILPVRGHTPPITKSDSPALQMHHGHTEAHKPLVSVQTTMPSIQISVQQRNKEVHARPLSQIQQAKAISVTQSMFQTGQPGQVSSQTQRVLGSSVAPMLQTTGVHTPLTLPTGQKIVGQMMSPMIRQSKIITSQSNLANISAQNATAFALSGGTRPPKIIVTQAGTQQNLATGTIITTMAKTSTIGQTIPRQQQKVMSHTGGTIATTTTVSSVAAKGAKITPQRQTAVGTHHGIAHLQQHSINHPHQQVSTQQQQVQLEPQALRVSSTTHQSIPHQGLVQQAVGGNAAAAASVYLQQKAGGATSVMVPNTSTGTIAQNQTGHTGDGSNREPSQERVLQSLQYNIPNNLAQYYQMGLYQQAMAASRPAMKITGQPSLTATLQGTAHAASITVSGAPVQGSGGPTPVRINNPPAVMVTVDPSTRHATNTLQQNSQHLSPAELLANKSGQQTQNFKYVNKADSNLVATMASTHLNAAMGASHVTQQSANQNTVPTGSNLTSSPRPSILRKRNNEGDRINAVKKQILGGPAFPAPSQPPAASLDSALEHHSQHHLHHQHHQQLHPHHISTSDHHQPHHPAAAISPKPSVLDPNNENSQSSTDTASSTQSTPQSKLHHLATTGGGCHKVKLECNETFLENGHLSGVLPNSNEASPRKKPRKQLLTHVNADEVKDTITDTDVDEEIEKFSKKVYSSRQLEKQQQEEEEDEEDEDDDELEEISEYVDDDGIRWVRERKRPPIALLNHYQCSWKPKNNHFLRPTDVKHKDERRPTVNELANQKNVTQKSSGWKMYHLAAQIEELMDIEKLVLDKMILVQEQVAPKHIAKTTMEDDIGMVHELSQGNIQRCQLYTDQMQEAKTAMIKILDHKKRINEIIAKHHSKRPVKKKDRS